MIVRIKTGSSRALLILRWAQGLFLVGGLLAAGYCGLALLDSSLFEYYHARSFEMALSQRTPQTPSPRSADSAASRSVGEGMTPIAARDKFPLGKIEIGRLGIEALILEGTNERSLRRAIGHLSGTSLPGEKGNVVLAGHRDTFLRSLRKIQKGDEIGITTLAGLYQYRVDDIKIVGPNDTYVIAPSDDSILTIVTCYPFYFVGPAPKRFIVRARLAPPA